MRLGALSLALLVPLGCDQSKSEPEPKVLASDDSEAPIELIGVDPEDFECDSVAPPEELREALGVDFEASEPQFDSPAGVPDPCPYLGRTPERPKWSFDIDCRERALEDGSALMVHYAKAPESNAVNVGKSGLDHSGASLLFIDDDTPCYVHVLGPDAESRLALARLVARRLTERTAPMGTTRREVE